MLAWLFLRLQGLLGDASTDPMVQAAMRNAVQLQVGFFVMVLVALVSTFAGARAWRRRR